MKPNEIKRLDWDSNFFKLEVGRALLFSKNDKLYNNDNNFDLIYLLHQDDFNYHINGYKNEFSELKITFKKTLINLNKTSKSNHIFLNPNIIIDQEYVNLALQSGEFSRFNLDPKINKKYFIKLYTIWISNGNEEVFVYKKENEIIGFITFSIFSDYSKVGLFAVKNEERGKQIGFYLLNALENELVKRGVFKVLISTQEVNKMACYFYNKNGYIINQKQYLKHYWKI